MTKPVTGCRRFTLTSPETILTPPTESFSRFTKKLVCWPPFQMGRRYRPDRDVRILVSADYRIAYLIKSRSESMSSACFMVHSTLSDISGERL